MVYHVDMKNTKCKKKIITVTYAAYSLAKRWPGNIQAYRNSKPDLNDTGATLLPIKLTNQMGAGC